MKSCRFVIAALFACVLPLCAQEADSGFDALQHIEMRRAAALMKMRKEAGTALPRSVDVKYYSLNIRVADEKNFLSGDVTAIATILDSSLAAVTYDLASTMTVDSVLVDGVRSAFVRSTAAVAITLSARYHVGDRVTTRVFYRGKPADTGFGSYVDTTDSTGTRWIYTLSEPYGARDWWPCIDHPNEKADSVDIAITCRTPLMAVTNGRLTATQSNTDGTTTYVWKERYPIATYLVSLNVGGYSTFSSWYRYSSADSMEVVNYVLPTPMRPISTYQTYATLTPRMLEVYAGIFGQYPFIKEKYGHVEFGWGGGMEHQTLTSVGTRAFTEGIIAHELAHQWFGDMITCRTWGDLWLNEGFAQYFQGVWVEKQGGEAFYTDLMASRIQDAKNAVGTLYVQDTTNVNNLFATSRVYDKGAWVLHMLRRTVGDSLFFASIRSYANDPALRFSTAATADLRRHFELVTHRDLGWFFNEWVFGERYPQYAYTLSTAADGARFRSALRIVQTTGTTNPVFFTMPIDVKLTAPGWDTTVTVFNTAGDETFQLALSHRPTAVLFDPRASILCDVTGSLVTTVGAAAAPLEYSLSQNYPNPFNPATVIAYTIPEESRVSIRLYDVVGREVATLVDERQAPGAYRLSVDGASLSSGIYLYRMTASKGPSVFTASRKLLLVR